LVQELNFGNGRRKDESLFVKPLLDGALASTATFLTLKWGKFGKIVIWFLDWVEFKKIPYVKKVTFYRIMDSNVFFSLSN
jgi:hypothetical protein